MTASLEIALVGAHMTGLPLNAEVVALGGRFLRAAETAPCYRLYALPGGPPPRPGLLRVAEGAGAAIAVEVWLIPLERAGALLAAIPAPLGLGTVRLADGAAPKGFLVEAEGTRGAEDISRFGGWRAFLAQHPPAGPPREPINPSDPHVGRHAQALAVDAAAALSGVAMRPAWREAALTNFATIAAAAQLVAEFPLDDEAESAQVFQP